MRSGNILTAKEECIFVVWRRIHKTKEKLIPRTEKDAKMFIISVNAVPTQHPRENMILQSYIGNPNSSPKPLALLLRPRYSLVILSRLILRARLTPIFTLAILFHYLQTLHNFHPCLKPLTSFPPMSFQSLLPPQIFLPCQLDLLIGLRE